MPSKNVYRITNEKLLIEVIQVEVCRTKLSEQLKRDTLHEELKLAYAKKYKADKVLEISSKSPQRLGSELRGSRLMLTTPYNEISSVDRIYLSSQKFSYGGPFHSFLQLKEADIYQTLAAIKLGKLQRFEYGNLRWPAQEARLFYNWLYLKALYEKEGGYEDVLNYNAFSDVQANEWDPFSYSQAQSAALFVLLHEHQLLHQAMKSPNHFRNIVRRVSVVKC